MSDATRIGEVMLALPGFQVLEAEEQVGELVIWVQTHPGLVGCVGCGVVACTHDRMEVQYRDLPAFGRPVRLVWRKRRYRCPEPECAVRTWTETADALASRCLLTRRAAVDCCVAVGRDGRPVAQIARELGSRGTRVMDAVSEYGQPLIDQPDRVGSVRALGVDETVWLSATRDHPRLYATGLVDLDARHVIDVIPGNRADDLGG